MTNVYKVVRVINGLFVSAVVNWDGLCCTYGIGIKTLPAEGTYLYAFDELSNAVTFVYKTIRRHADRVEVLACTAETVSIIPTATTPYTDLEEILRWWRKGHRSRELVPFGTIWCEWIVPTTIMTGW